MDVAIPADFDAVVLAGGGARRLGGVDKMALTVDGATLLERVLGAVSGARRRVVVGPRREVGANGLVWCREEPAGGGPVAALAAGVRLTQAPVVVVLAGDLPWIAPAVPDLLAALSAGVDAVELVDPGGRANHLAAAWRRAALVSALASLGDAEGASMRALVARVRRVGLADPAGWGRDCDTWDDLAGARRGRPDGQETTRSSPA